jgi:hypothetical protein
MGIFDLLSKEGRARSALDSAIKKTTNKFVQSQDRYSAMEKLRDLGSDEALYGLCRRFGINVDKTIEDEQEKQWVQDTLVGLGDRALPPVRKWIMQGETASYAFSVLEQIAPPEKVLEIVDELLAREEPGYARHPQKKIQVLSWLGEWTKTEPAEVARRVAPYLKDFDETVRFTAVEALAHARPHEETSRGPLVEALLRPEEESRRILVRIAEVLAERGWRVDEAQGPRLAELVAAKLPEFSIDKDRRLQKKAR